MKNKLFIGSDVLEKFDSEFLRRLCQNDYDEYKSIATYGEDIKLDNDLFLSKDDMDNLYLYVDKENEVYSEIDDVRECIFEATIDEDMNIF